MDRLKKARAKDLEDRINKQLDAYARKQGIEPGPECPVFLDLDGDMPIPLTTEKLRQRLALAAMEGGADPTTVLLRFGFDTLSHGKA